MTSRNLRFELLVNGQRRSVAGLEAMGVLDFALSSAGAGTRSGPLNSSKAEYRLGALDAASSRLVEWLNGSLAIGDEITIRILPPGEFDSPRQRKQLVGRLAKPMPIFVTSPRT